MVSAEDYAKIVEGFRQCGTPNVSKVATAVGFSRETIRKAYTEGWPARKLGPIKDLGLWSAETFPGSASAPVSHIPEKAYTSSVIDEEEGRGSGPASESPSDRFDAASQSVAHSSTAAATAAPSPTQNEKTAVEIAEGKNLVTSRRVLEGLLVSANNILSALFPAINRMAETVQDDIARGIFAERYGIDKVIGYVDQLSQAAPRLVAASKQLMESQRLLDNKPQSITEGRSVGGNREDDETRDARLAMMTGHVVATMLRAPGRTVIDVDAVPYRGEESAKQLTAEEPT